jgi:hypothetical protein
VPPSVSPKPDALKLFGKRSRSQIRQHARRFDDSGSAVDDGRRTAVKQMKHRYEAKSEADGSWTIIESLDGSTVGRSAGLTRREAWSDAVRLNRDALRNERALRVQKAEPPELM